MTDTTADILRKARDHIAEPGMWWQGEYFPGYDIIECTTVPNNTPCCAFGAIGWAMNKDPDLGGFAADRALMKAARLSGIGDVASWNDAPERTQSEVVALFDRAIELAEKGASRG